MDGLFYRVCGYYCRFVAKQSSIDSVGVLVDFLCNCVNIPSFFQSLGVLVVRVCYWGTLSETVDSVFDIRSAVALLITMKEYILKFFMFINFFLEALKYKHGRNGCRSHFFRCYNCYHFCTHRNSQTAYSYHH